MRWINPLTYVHSPFDECCELPLLTLLDKTEQYFHQVDLRIGLRMTEGPLQAGIP